MSFLKELDMEDVITDIKKKEEKLAYPSEFRNNELMNKTIKELQEEFDCKKSAVNRLRGICINYREEEDDGNGNDYRKESVSSGSDLNNDNDEEEKGR